MGSLKPDTPRNILLVAMMSLEQCLVSSSTDVNNNLTSAWSRSLSSGSDCVTSSSDYRLQERTNFRENQTAGESVSSTTAEGQSENKSFMEELVIDLIH